MNLTKNQFKAAHEVYLGYVRTLKNLEGQLRGLSLERGFKEFRKELESKIDCYKRIVEALKEYETKLGVYNEFTGSNLVEDGLLGD